MGRYVEHVNTISVAPVGGTPRILIQCAPRNAHQVRAIRNIRWDPKAKLWHVEQTPEAMEEVARRLPGFEFQSTFQAAAKNLHEEKVVAAVVQKMDTTQPPVRVADSWPHQAAAYNFAMNCGPAAMLAMAMGTGKTKVAIDVLMNRTEPGDIVLILCPLAVVPVWGEQIDRWGAGHGAGWSVSLLDRMTGAQKSAEIVRVRKEAKKQLVAKAAGQPVAVQRFAIVLNYDSVWRPIIRDELERTELRYVIADESHRIKQHNGQASKAVTAIGKVAEFRLALTGTPMAHSPLDIFAQYRFLDPKIFGQYWTAFKRRYAIRDENSMFERIVGYKETDDLKERANRIMFLLETNAVLALPEAVHTNRYCVLEPDAQRAYRDLEYRLYAAWKDNEISISNALVKVLRLQQVTGGTIKMDDGTEERVSHAKQILLTEVLDDIDPAEPVVIFAQFRSELGDIREAAASAGRPYLELSGTNRELAEWQAATGGEVLGVQVQSGSEGVSMTRAKYCIYYSTGYSLGRYEQSIARVHRPGQDRNVTYIHLVAAGTIDEKIQKALADRKTTIRAILGEGGPDSIEEPETEGGLDGW